MSRRTSARSRCAHSPNEGVAQACARLPSGRLWPHTAPHVGEETAINRALYRCLMVAVACTSMWMRTGFPIYGVEDAPFDDNMFIRFARTIGAGHWLGPYDNATLVKGAIYPLFTALAHLLSVPLKMAEQAAYIGTCLLIANLVSARLPRGPILGLILFALLCFNPTLWYPDLARVTREGLYISLTLLVLGLTTIAAFPPPRRSLPTAVLIGLGFGLALGAFWNTREEGVALVPAIAIIAACGLARRQSGHRLATACAATLGCAAVTFAIATTNDHYYGAFETVEVKTHPFERAYGALVRIKPDHYQRYVVFPEDARKRAYAVSPAARELAPIFEGPYGQQWALIRCAEFGIDPCSGVHAGWFQWVFREAVARAGHYASPSDAAAYYDRLAREIDAACDDGKLRCLPPRATLMPPFRWSYAGDTWRKSLSILTLLTDLGSDNRQLQDSGQSRGFLDDISDVVGPVLPVSAPRLKLQGWAAAPGAPPLIQIRRRDFGNAATSLNLVGAFDVDLSYPSLHAVRFNVTTDCPENDCDLVLSTQARADIVVPLAKIMPGDVNIGAPTKLFIDSALRDTSFASTASLRHVQAAIARKVARAYALACHLLLPLASLGFVLAAVRWRRSTVPLAVFALAAGCAAAVLCRVLLLAYLDVTTIPFNPTYIMTVSPCLLLFVALGLYAGATSYFQKALVFLSKL